MANSDNPRVGREFQELTCRIMSEHFHKVFQMETPIGIGQPPKLHKFDCVAQDHSVVIECKCYTWTSTGNVPSAKLMGLNEAVFYMSYLPENTIKVIAMKKAIFPGKHETLAEYYNRIDGHLLHNILIVEIDEDGSIRWIR